MARGNDFCNNELLNAVVHNVDPAVLDDDDRKVRRGIPRAGKLIFESGQILVCVDEDPDPAFDGGGTYVPVGGGQLVTLGVFTLGLTQGADVFQSAEQFSMTRTIYAAAATYEIGWLQGTFSMAAATGASAATVIVPTMDIAPGLFAETNENIGTGIHLRGTTRTPLHVGLTNTSGPGSTPVQFSLRKSSDGTELGASVTLAAADELSFSVGFSYYIEL